MSERVNKIGAYSERASHRLAGSGELAAAAENRIQTYLVSRVFDDTTTSYKLFWFRALLETLKQRWNSEPGVVYEPILVSDLLSEMVVAAWHPVCLFRLSLGATDKLQDTCDTLQKLSGLAANTKARQVRNFIAATPEILEHLWNLATYVPALFLTPWFSVEMYGISAGTARVKRAIQLARERRARQEAPPYWLDGKGRNVSLQIDRRWGDFLYENLGVLEAFADRYLAQYLQAKNPNSPGIIHKLREPPRPQLAPARRFWKCVREVFVLRGISAFFQDIYRGERIDADFSIDHFLPWSLVAHDQFWNLAPVFLSTNSRKSDTLPDPDLYLPRLVKLHWHALRTINDRPRFYEDYVACFKQTSVALLEGNEERLLNLYRTVVIPQIELARNQGFEVGWRLKNGMI